MKPKEEALAADAHYLRWIRVVLTARFSFSALAASVAIFALVFVALRLVGVEGQRAAGYLQSVRDRHTEQALASEMERIGGQDCKAEPVFIRPHDFWVFPVRAVAYVRCQVDGSGVSGLEGISFTSQADLENWDAARGEYAASMKMGGTCEGGPGRSAWSDGSDRIRGEMTCYVTPHGSAEMTWSDNNAKVGYTAYSTQAGLGSLFDWWQHHVRGAKIEEDAGALRHDFGSEITGGLHNCRGGRSPLADDVLFCNAVHAANDPGATADWLVLYHFATEQQLNSFYSAYTTAFNAPERNSRGVDCSKAEFVSTTYNEPTEGRIFCFAASAGEYGASWLLWTRDHELVAGLLERSDQNEQALYRIWSDIY